jgi:hypothetical protein
LLRRIEEVLAASAARRAADARETSAFDSWTKAGLDVLARSPDGWVIPPTKVDPPGGLRHEGRAVVPQADGSLLLGGKGKGKGKGKSKGEHRVRLQAAPGWVAAVRLEALPHEAHRGCSPATARRGP